jgi:hypothetical protein
LIVKYPEPDHLVIEKEVNNRPNTGVQLVYLVKWYLYDGNPAIISIMTSCMDIGR